MATLNQTAAIVLGAGSSQRFGDENKLLSVFEGQPLIAHSLTMVRAAGITPAVVVTGQDREAVTALAGEYGFEPIHNPHHEEGMGRSIAVGAQALQSFGKHIFVIPGDMPRLPREIFARLASALETSNQICRPEYDGKPGHPVLFGSDYLDALVQLDGDEGARSLIAANRPQLITLPTDDSGVVFDIDAPQK